MQTFNKKAFRIILLQAKGTRGVNQFAAQAGISSSYVSELINLKRSSAPSMNILTNIARVAQNNVCLNDLMKAAGYIDNLFEGDDLIEDDDLMDDLIEDDPSESLKTYTSKNMPDDLSMIPFLINITTNDKSIFNKNNIKKYGYENIEDVRYGTYFYYPAPDNSMEDFKISKGDNLTIRYQDRLENNKIFIILLHKKLTLRKVFLKGNYIVFTADNTKVEPEVFNIDIINNDVVEVIGKVAYIKIKL